MNATEVTIARLLSISALVALVSQKVTAVQFQQDTRPPAVRVITVSDFEPMHLRGSSGLLSARVQVDVLGATYAQAVAVMAVVHGTFAGGVSTGLNGWSGTVGGSPGVEVTSILPDPAGVRDLYDPDERKQFLQSRDYFVMRRA